VCMQHAPALFVWPCVKELVWCGVIVRQAEGPSNSSSAHLCLCKGLVCQVCSVLDSLGHMLASGRASLAERECTHRHMS
jgi:hypothetical protein